MKKSKSKTYLVHVIDWSYPKGKIVSARFVDGLAEVRKTFRGFTFYHSDTGVWIAYGEQLEVLAVKV